MRLTRFVVDNVQWRPNKWALDLAQIPRPPRRHRRTRDRLAVARHHKAYATQPGCFQVSRFRSRQSALLKFDFPSFRDELTIDLACQSLGAIESPPGY
jgi:hypothetical protein